MYGVHGKPSTIQHADTHVFLFSRKHFAQRWIKACKYGILASSDGALFDRNENYCEIVIARDGTHFKKDAIQLNVEIASSHVDNHNVWIFPAKFCCLWFINDSRYLNWEKPASSDNEGRSACVFFDEELMVRLFILRINTAVIRYCRNISLGKKAIWIRKNNMMNDKKRRIRIETKAVNNRFCEIANTTKWVGWTFWLYNFIWEMCLITGNEELLEDLHRKDFLVFQD